VKRLALVPLLLAPSLADAAACHHYSRWYYPTPQPRCGLYARVTPAQVQREDRSWYVEFILPDVDERTRGLEELKTLLKNGSADHAQR
jgi:hypothetical protein